MSEETLEQSHKLFYVLASFSKKDTRDFGLFLRSPYFCSNEGLQGFMEVCLSYTPAFRVTKKEIFAGYKKGRYNDLKFRHLCAEGLQLVYRFFRHRRLEEDERTGEMTLLAELNARGLAKIFSRRWDQEKKSLEAEPLSEASYFQSFLLEKQKGSWIEGLRDRSLDPNLPAISASFDAFYMLQKLRLLCTSVSFGNVAAQKIPVGFAAPVLEYIAAGSREIPLLTRMYYRAYKILTDPSDTASYHTLLQELESRWKEIGSQEARDLVVMCRNYGIKKVNLGETAYFHDLFRLYKLELDSGLALENGEINPFVFKNIITTALQLGETEWAEKFSDQYRELLPSSQRQQVYQFNLARICFAKSQYKEAKQILFRTRFKERFNYLDARVLMIKIYFETSDDEAMVSACEAFRNHLQRNYALAYHRKNYLNFIRFITRMVNTTSPSKRKKLRKDIRECKELIDKNWLIERAA